MSIFTFQSLNEINVLTFEKISETDNFLLMDKNYSENKKYTIDDLEFCKDAYLKLVDLFIEKLNNKKALSNFADTKKKTELTYKIHLLYTAFNSIIFLAKNYKDLKDWQKLEKSILNSVKKISPFVNFSVLNDFEDSLKIIDKLIKSNELTFKRLFSDDKIKEQKKYTIDEQILDITILLDLKFELDIETMTLEKWVNWLNKAENKIQQLRKQENGRSKK